MSSEEVREFRQSEFDTSYASRDKAHTVILNYMLGNSVRRTPGRLQVLEDVVSHGIGAVATQDVIGSAIVQSVDIQNPRIF